MMARDINSRDIAMQNAPFYADVADGPDGGKAYWLTTEDGARIRIAVWSGGKKGTVLMFPGRTEYIEKYGRAARSFEERGFSMVAVDWRGQGLADRLLKDRSLGHVDRFTDYQMDVRAVLQAVETLDLPRPLSLFGHSMGGCIGLRGLLEDIPVNAAVFTGPMWGIAMEPLRRVVGWTLSSVSRHVRLDRIIAPGTERETYVKRSAFTDNMLTTDAEMFAYIQMQVAKYPDLALGGPTLAWVNEGLKECRALKLRPSPNVPAHTFLGTNERIVDPSAIHDRMSRWQNGTLTMVSGAEHEVAMEIEATQKLVFDTAAELYTNS